MQKQRIVWLDMAKGWGMLLIIIGHLNIQLIPQLTGVQVWIYSFHIPLFFFLSGYLFSTGKSLKEFAKKKLRTIVLPYFVFGVVILIYETYTAVRYSYFSSHWFWETVSRFLIQNRFWTIWFLAAVLVLNIMMYLMVRLLKKRWLLAAVSVVLAACAMIYYAKGGDKLPWDIDVAFAAIPYFCGGYLLRSFSEKMESLLSGKLRSVIIFVVCTAVNIVAAWLNYRHMKMPHDMFGMKYGIVLLAYLSAFAGIMAMIVFSHWFRLRPVQFIGENSILYLAWHQTIVIPVVKGILTNLHFTVDYGNPAGKILLYLLAELSLVLLIMTAVIKLINNTKLRYLVGKKKE